VVAGGLALGMEVYSLGAVAGRVAMVLGGELVWAPAGCMFKRKALDSKDAASVLRLSALGFMFINLLPSDQ
jgi:hypothetical protein